MFLDVVIGRSVVILFVKYPQFFTFCLSDGLIVLLLSKLLICLTKLFQFGYQFPDFWGKLLIIFAEGINVMVHSGCLREDVLSSVILLGQVEPELLHEVEHEAVVLADPGGATVHWTIFGQL